MGGCCSGATVALSELYNAVLSDYLTSALGWGWEPMVRRHSAAPKYEVAGVSAVKRPSFSAVPIRGAALG